MTEQQFNDYFRKVATELKEIAHSAEQERFVLIDELGNSLRNSLNYDTYIMVVSHEQASLRNFANLQTLQEVHSCSFAILQKCGTEDYDQMEQAYTACYQVARKIISRMIKEFQDQPVAMNDSIMRFLQPESLSIDKLGYVADNLFGWEVNFQMLGKEGCDYKYNETDWIV